MVRGQDAQGRLCGFLKVELPKEHAKPEFVERYLVLDLVQDRLFFYYDSPEHLPKTSADPCKEINISFISQVTDARKSKPKAGYCFCITHDGDQCYVQADSEDEMTEWIEQLNSACKIKVPVKATVPLAAPNTSHKVVGGVLITQQEESKEETQDHTPSALDLPSYKAGYATKQGAVRKNWKRRYFVLYSNGLSYYKFDKDKEPIRTLPLHEIKEALLVGGVHHPHRKNLFEVVTKDRTFNVQCETEADAAEWIDLINKHTKNVHSANIKDFTESESVASSYTKPVKSRSRPSSQEEVDVTSRAVWGDCQLRPVERRSKMRVRGSKKSWSLW